MQGAEIEDEGSVLKYITKSEIEEQRSSLLIMTQRLLSCVRVNILARPSFRLFVCGVRLLSDTNK